MGEGTPPNHSGIREERFMDKVVMDFVRDQWRRGVDYSNGLYDAIEELRLRDDLEANVLLSCNQTVNPNHKRGEYKRNIEHQILRETGRGHLIGEDILAQIEASLYLHPYKGE
jgi:hypothetical protein